MREGKEGRAQGRGSAEERLEPPHSYHRRWVIWYKESRPLTRSGNYERGAFIVSGRRRPTPPPPITMKVRKL